MTPKSDKLWRIAIDYLRRSIVAFVTLIDNKTGVLSLVLIPYICFRLRKLTTTEELLKGLFRGGILALLFKPIQIPTEISAFVKIVQSIKPRYILEIGTARGGTLLLWTRVGSEDATIISIDLPGGSFGGGYPFLRRFVYIAFRRGRQKIILIRGDSHDPRTLEKCERILRGNKLDFLFIDGDHSYEGVRRDFAMYSPLVRKGGIIAFHDIIPDHFTRFGIRSCSTTGGVPKFWEDIKHDYKHLEIVQNYEQDGYGIGIIWYDG